MRTFLRSTAVAALLVVPAAVAAAAPGGNGADNKEDGPASHDYDASAESSAGLDPLGLGVVTTGSSSDGHTDGEGTTAGADAGGVAILGTTVSEGASCDSEGGDGGAVSNRDATSLHTVSEGPVTIALLASECNTHAVKANNAHGDASAAVVGVGIDGVATADVLSTRSRTRTTSGQATTSASTALVDAEVAGTDVDVLVCEDHARANHGTSADESTVTVLGVAGQAVEAPVPCLLGGNEANAVYTRN